MPLDIEITKGDLARVRKQMPRLEEFPEFLLKLEAILEYQNADTLVLRLVGCRKGGE